jgi:peptidoglycan/LPS O-acetylase OafA/YrhL
MNKVTTLNFYKKSLDGLRGLASLNVALSHFFGAFLPTVLHSNYPNVFHGGLENAYTDIIGSPLATIFFNGHFAVLLFFVLSGYVLSLPYYHNINYISLLK